MGTKNDTALRLEYDRDKVFVYDKRNLKVIAVAGIKKGMFNRIKLKLVEIYDTADIDTLISALRQAKADLSKIGKYI